MQRAAAATRSLAGQSALIITALVGLIITIAAAIALATVRSKTPKAPPVGAAPAPQPLSAVQNAVGPGAYKVTSYSPSISTAPAAHPPAQSSAPPAREAAAYQSAARQPLDGPTASSPALGYPPPSSVRLGLHVQGPDGDRHITVNLPAVVGSAPDAEVVLADSTASQHHCLFALERGYLTVSDLGSPNGITINDARMPRASLRPGCYVTVGMTRLTIE